MGSLTRAPLAAALLAAAHPCMPGYAQEPELTTISGMVLDQNTAEPIARVLVIVEGTDLAVITDEQGRYRLTSVPPGSRVLRASRIGYAVARVAVAVPGAGSMERDIQMSASALELPGITVVADPASRAGDELGTASVIGRDAIDHMTATSLAGVLQLVPGIETRAPGLSDIEQIALRTAPTASSRFVSSADGGWNRNSADLAAFGTLIVLDGIPLSNNANLQSVGPRGAGIGFLGFPSAANGGVDLRRIPAAAIERIEVIRGVPSVRYGDLTQGAIVIETRVAPVASPVEVRFDERTIETSVAGGGTFDDGRHTGAVTLDFARTRTEPGVSDDESARFYLQLAHRVGATNPRFALDTRLELFRLVDDRPENPNVRPNAASRSLDQGFRLLERARLRLGETSHLSLTASFSRGEQESQARVPMVSGTSPFTSAREEGRHEGFYVGGAYDSDIEFHGRPHLAFARLEWDRRGASNHHAVGGIELRREWNDGAGFRFDPRFPLSVGSSGVRGYNRPRDFGSIPAAATSALYLGDHLYLRLGAWRAEVQAGIRADLLHSGGQWFGGVRDLVLQPRVSAEIQPWPQLRLRGGWGRTTKTPAIGDLHPAPQYFDVVNVNYYARDPAERLAILTTFVRDPADAGLGFSVATKTEAGVEVAAGGANIALTAFRDRIAGGAGIGRVPDAITRDHFALTDSVTGNGVKPEIVLPPEFTDTVPVLIDRPSSILSQVNRGIELTAALPEIARLATQLHVTGSWVETKTSSDALFFESAGRFAQFQQSAVRTRGPFWEGMTERGEVMLLVYRLIHRQPRLGLVATLTVQHDARQEIEDLVARDSLAFSGYLARSGQLVRVPPERRGDPEFADLRLVRPALSLGIRAAPDWLAHLQVSKTLPLDGQLRVWVFNLADRRGQPHTPDRLGRFYEAVRFGAELMFPTARLFGR